MMSMEGLRGKQCKIRVCMHEEVARFIGEREREDGRQSMPFRRGSMMERVIC